MYTHASSEKIRLGCCISLYLKKNIDTKTDTAQRSGALWYNLLWSLQIAKLFTLKLYNNTFKGQTPAFTVAEQSVFEFK